MISDPLSQAYIIKGFLLAQDRNAAVLEGIEAIIAELGGKRTPMDYSKLSPAEAANLFKVVDNFIPAKEHQRTDRPGIDNQSNSTPLKKERKKMAPRTEEQKEKLREQLKHARAVRDQKRADNPPPDFRLDDDPPPPPVEPPPRPKDNLSEYIGERTDRTLVDHDWGDIQKMRYNGLPDARIAKSYGIGLDYLMRFTERQEAKEKAQGNG